jgi:hypothetical protein
VGAAATPWARIPAAPRRRCWSGKPKATTRRRRVCWLGRLWRSRLLGDSLSLFSVYASGRSRGKYLWVEIDCAEFAPDTGAETESVGVGDDLGPSDGRCAVSDGLFETSSEVSAERNLARTVSPLCRPGTICSGFEGRVVAKEATYSSGMYTNSYSDILSLPSKILI